MVIFLQAYLESSIAADSGIAKEEASSALNSVCRNRIGRDVAWDWLRKDYEEIRSYFGPSLTFYGPIEDMAITISSDFNTKFKLEELQEFVGQHIDDFGVDNRELNKAIQKVKANINWIDTNYETIVYWLQNRTPDETTTTEPTTNTQTGTTSGSKSSLTSSGAINILLIAIATWTFKKLFYGNNETY